MNATEVNKFFMKCLQKPLLAVSFLIVVAGILMAITGSAFAPHDPLKTNMTMRLAGPSFQYPLGNDFLGRCLLSRILAGAGISIGLGFAVVMISTFLGAMVGLISGIYGGYVDEVLMRTTDIFFSFPEIIAAMAIAGMMGPGTMNLLFALSFLGWMRYARVVRAIALSVKERDYVKAARLYGVSGPMIVFRHILPAIMPSVIVLATIGLAKAILAVSALGFLGFGAQPPSPEWGTLLMEGKDFIFTAPHLSIYPGIAVTATAMAFNLTGDALRDWITDDGHPKKADRMI